jgi:hypothetical protein
MEHRPGGHPMNHFDAANLNQAVTASRVQAGRLGIENDLTHSMQSGPAVMALQG